MRVRMIMVALAFWVLSGCTNLNTAGISKNDASAARAAAHEFAKAIRAGNAQRLRAAVVVDAPMQPLGDNVIGDTVNSRLVMREMASRFDVSPEASAVASDAWLDLLESRLEFAPLVRERPADGDQRICFNVLGRGPGANVHLREVAGMWKVELISTLVPEADGLPTVDDVAVPYRYGVTRAMKGELLGRLTRGEFVSAQAYENARQAFWTEFLTSIANGRDPHDTMKTPLPVMPADRAMADER